MRRRMGRRTAPPAAPPHDRRSPNPPRPDGGLLFTRTAPPQKSNRIRPTASERTKYGHAPPLKALPPDPRPSRPDLDSPPAAAAECGLRPTGRLVVHGTEGPEPVRKPLDEDSVSCQKDKPDRRRARQEENIAGTRLVPYCSGLLRIDRSRTEDGTRRGKSKGRSAAIHCGQIPTEPSRARTPNRAKAKYGIHAEDPSRLREKCGRDKATT
jgi:hypothetical protein